MKVCRSRTLNAQQFRLGLVERVWVEGGIEAQVARQHGSYVVESWNHENYSRIPPTYYTRIKDARNNARARLKIAEGTHTLYDAMGAPIRPDLKR